MGHKSRLPQDSPIPYRGDGIENLKRRGSHESLSDRRVIVVTDIPALTETPLLPIGIRQKSIRFSGNIDTRLLSIPEEFLIRLHPPHTESGYVSVSPADGIEIDIARHGDRPTDIREPVRLPVPEKKFSDTDTAPTLDFRMLVDDTFRKGSGGHDRLDRGTRRILSAHCPVEERPGIIRQKLLIMLLIYTPRKKIVVITRETHQSEDTPRLRIHRDSGRPLQILRFEQHAQTVEYLLLQFGIDVKDDIVSGNRLDAPEFLFDLPQCIHLDPIRPVFPPKE